jgi:hypothetical protein
MEEPMGVKAWNLAEYIKLQEAQLALTGINGSIAELSKAVTACEASLQNFKIAYEALEGVCDRHGICAPILHVEASPNRVISRLIQIEDDDPKDH